VLVAMAPRRPARLGLWVIVTALVAGCRSPPFGEVLVVVDTNVSVPRLADHLRIDLYDESGAWYESRDVATLRPSDWPVSFGLYTDAPGARTTRVRLRSYPRDGLRTYAGEQLTEIPAYVEPPVAHSLEQLCDGVVSLAPNVELTQRRGATPITEHRPQADCLYKTNTGSTAVKITIERSSTYRFEVMRTSPPGQYYITGDTALYLRTACDVEGSQIACADDIDAATNNYLSRLVVQLDPGEYYLLTSGRYRASPADITLRWADADDPSWIPTPPGATPPPAAEVSAAEPRLVVDGRDLTPALEPRPNLAIDTIVDVSVTYGARQTAHVLLDGECLGVQADLATGRTCGADQALAAVPRAELDEGIDHPSDSRAGSWSGEAEGPCTSPQPGTASAELLDETVCIPSGAFIMGSVQASGLGELSAVPQQVASLAPFWLDRYEVTVARFRQALAAGFELPDQTPLVNDGKLSGTSSMSQARCTFSGDERGPASGIDRERYPINCLSWYTARALCQFWGGDLPTSAEWEFAARAAGRPADTAFPWGDTFPTCEQTVFGGLDVPTVVDAACPGNVGPFAVDAPPWAENDVTPLGVVGMAGNVTEWTRDSARAYADPCWWQHHLRGVACDEVDAPYRSQRGGSWWDPIFSTPSYEFLSQVPAESANFTGFRCAYRGVP
jgi:formylglycine-generating enzyme required for sulfatase activity